MDALAAASLGYRAIAILGAAPPPVVFDHLARLLGVDKQTIIVPDMDRLGSWVQVQHQLGQRGVTSTLVYINGYKDLAAMPPEYRKEFLDGAQD